MRTSRNLPSYSILFLYIFTFTVAWPLAWPRWLPELDSLVVRDSGNSTTSSTITTTQSGSSVSETGKPSTSISVTDSGSAKTSTGSSSKNTASSSTTATHTTYSANLPAGGVSLITPAVASGSQFYKIGDYVTFAWNYTSLEATPTAVNIMATCTANQILYTIQANQTVANATGAVTWDTGAYQATAVQNPLLTDTYTLLIYDADSSASAVASAGYLAPYDSYVFGMYTGQPYVPLDQYVCATCSGALSDMERRALGMVVGMGMLTVLSFTWFVCGLGVIW